jgi:hypothetical protein
VVDQVDHAFSALLIFMSVVVQEQDAGFPCSTKSAACLAMLLPELVDAGLCASPESWQHSLNNSNLLPVDHTSVDKAQHTLQGAVETAHTSALLVDMLPHLQGTFQDTTTPGTGVWLVAVPSDPTLIVPNEAFLHAARSKLLCLAAGAVHLCTACSARPVDPTHMWSCASLSCLCTAHHNEVVQQVLDTCCAQGPHVEHMFPAHQAAASNGLLPTLSGMAPEPSQA